jgi:hypothetical protein
LTDPDPSRFGSTSQVGWIGPKPNCYLNSNKNFKKLIQIQNQINIV